ncbi:hypothetical protein RBB50_008085 [Rhinocladiella similis]
MKGIPSHTSEILSISRGEMIRSQGYAIDFTLTPTQEDLKAPARRFALDVLARAHEEYLKLPRKFLRYQSTRKTYQRLVEEVWIKIQIPEQYGGTRDSLVDLAIIAEELSTYDSSNPITWLVTGLGLASVFMFAKIVVNEVDINVVKQWASSSGSWEFKGASVLSLLCRLSDQGAPKDTLGFVIITTKQFEAEIERAIEVVNDIETHGFRASSGPRTKFTNFRVSTKKLLTLAGTGAMVNVATFTESATLVGAGAAGLMRYCFSHTHKFVTTEKRGGSVSTISYQPVANFLISMKGREEIIWYLTWESCHYLETTGESELAYQAKVFGYENAVQAVLKGMRALAVTAYDTKQPTRSVGHHALSSYSL